MADCAGEAAIRGCEAKGVDSGKEGGAMPCPRGVLSRLQVTVWPTALLQMAVLLSTKR